MSMLKPKDITAWLLIIGIVVLLSRGINGGIASLLALIVGYYFGHRDTGIDNGK